MKITNVSCTQFAGVRDCNVSFADGINVIYGKNESGKSTLVNLLARTLFQNAKVNKRTDKAFTDLYYPSAKKGSKIAGDFADGKITFETEKGSYTLSKEWGADARCSLSTPEGVIRDPVKIDEVLKEALLYGEGVYSNLVFSSQRNSDAALQMILDASSKNAERQIITNAVSQAFAQSDGISMDAIEQAIAAKIEEIAGKHWDENREAPVRKSGRWANGLGEIVKAYYQLEDARDALEEISRLERSADQAAKDFIDRDVAENAAKAAYEDFSEFANLLSLRSERIKTIASKESNYAKMAEVLLQWPKLSEKLEKAKSLQSEKAKRSVLDTWTAVQEARAELSDEDYEAAKLPCPESAELSKAKKLQAELDRLESQLCGMNLKAAIQMLGGNEVQIVSLRTGEKVDTTGGLASITEAVKITIPGVMEMQLSPADVDVAAVEAQIAKTKEAIAGIFAKYKVETRDELEDYAQRIDNAKRKIENVNARIERVLGSASLTELEEQAQQLGPVQRSKEEIEGDILALCGDRDVDKYINQTETVVGIYASDYGSLERLSVLASDLQVELKKAQEAVAKADNIPAQYLNIANPDAHLEALKRDWDAQRKLREATLTDKTTAANRLEDYKEKNPEACQETVDKAERKFMEVQSLLKNWRHIEAVFKAQKELLHNNPMEDLAQRFAHYLGVISSGRVSTEFPEADKLNMSIYSDNKLLDYGKLSEGTKETVSLAFRLAVLDHLFPEGGGVIVFDDPFTDMDAERAAQSCQLIKDCATRHQVIFLTCREDYLSVLEGKHILF